MKPQTFELLRVGHQTGASADNFIRQQPVREFARRGYGNFKRGGVFRAVGKDKITEAVYYQLLLKIFETL